jgi:hypothetical protein
MQSGSYQIGAAIRYSWTTSEPRRAWAEFSEGVVCDQSTQLFSAKSGETHVSLPRCLAKLLPRASTLIRHPEKRAYRLQECKDCGGCFLLSPSGVHLYLGVRFLQSDCRQLCPRNGARNDSAHADVNPFSSRHHDRARFFVGLCMRYGEMGGEPLLAIQLRDLVMQTARKTSIKHDQWLVGDFAQSQCPALGQRKSCPDTPPLEPPARVAGEQSA